MLQSLEVEIDYTPIEIIAEGYYIVGEGDDKKHVIIQDHERARFDLLNKVTPKTDAYEHDGEFGFIPESEISLLGDEKIYKFNPSEGFVFDKCTSLGKITGGIRKGLFILKARASVLRTPAHFMIVDLEAHQDQWSDIEAKKADEIATYTPGFAVYRNPHGSGNSIYTSHTNVVQIPEGVHMREFKTTYSLEEFGAIYDSLIRDRVIFSVAFLGHGRVGVVEHIIPSSRERLRNAPDSAKFLFQFVETNPKFPPTRDEIDFIYKTIRLGPAGLEVMLTNLFLIKTSMPGLEYMTL